MTRTQEFVDAAFEEAGRISSHSGQSGQCVEVAPLDPEGAE